MIALNTSVVSGVAIALIEGQPRLLLMQRTKGDFWCHVAGKIEGSETGWEAIVREFREETQIVVKRLYSAEYIEQFYVAETDTILMIPAFVVYCDANQSVQLNDEHSDYRWCSLDEAIKLAEFPNQVSLYRHVWQHFVEREPSARMAVTLPGGLMH